MKGNLILLEELEVFLRQEANRDLFFTLQIDKISLYFQDVVTRKTEVNLKQTINTP